MRNHISACAAFVAVANADPSAIEFAKEASLNGYQFSTIQEFEQGFSNWKSIVEAPTTPNTS